MSCRLLLLTFRRGEFPHVPQAPCVAPRLSYGLLLTFALVACRTVLAWLLTGRVSILVFVRLLIVDAPCSVSARGLAFPSRSFLLVLPSGNPLSLTHCIPSVGGSRPEYCPAHHILSAPSLHVGLYLPSARCIPLRSVPALPDNRSWPFPLLVVSPVSALCVWFPAQKSTGRRVTRTLHVAIVFCA